MQDNSPILLKLHKLTRFTSGELEFIISHVKGTFTLEVPCPSIGSSQSFQDTASDLLEALFVGETIAEFCKDASFYGGWDEIQKWKTINFIFTPQNPTEIANKLCWLSSLFEDNEDEETRGELLEIISEFQDEIGLFEKTKYHFPTLVDNYLANYMIGLEEDSYLSDDTLSLSEIDKNNPAQMQSYIYNKYKYIKSMFQGDPVHDLYFSTEDSTWIILSSDPVDFPMLEQLIEQYRNQIARPLELQQTTVIATDTFRTVAFNQVEAVRYPFEKLTKAQECVADIYSLEKGITIDRLNATKVKKNLLSSYGDILIVVDQMAQYLFFSDSLQTIPPESLSEIATSSPALKAHLDNLQEWLAQRTQALISYNKSADQEP